MKKIVSMLLACFLCLSVVGCGGNSTDNSVENSSATTCKHMMKSWVVAKDATCAETGVKEYRCTDCGEFYLY